MRKRLAAVGKWTWVVCVAAAAAWIVWRSRVDIVRMFEQIPWWMLLASLALTLLAKLFLGENARIAARRSGIVLDYATATRLYNLSQLGKYLPGSIWQFVGRAAAYRNLGGGYAQIRDSLLTESLWIIGGAAATALILCGASILPVIRDSLTPLMRNWLLAAAAAAAVAGMILFAIRRQALLKYLASAIPTPRAVLVQAAIWISLGGSFWVLVRACGMEAGLPFAIGLFAAGYAVGFLVPFAPAGLGIRDGILTLGLIPFTTAGEAIAVTIMARLVYLVAELLLVAAQEPLRTVLVRLAGPPQAR